MDSIPPLVERFLQGHTHDDQDRAAQAATSQPLSDQEKIGFGIMVTVTIILCCGVYFCYRCWKERRERHLMELVNAHADNMLGDMVMVATGSFNEDDDDDHDHVDAELI